MTGIMAAVAGTSQNIIYAAGLYNTTTGVDQSPINGSVNNFNTGTTVTRNYTWIGYFTPASDSTVSLSLQTTATTGGGFGDSASTTGRLWLGATAKSGFTDGNANITATGNQTVSASFPMLLGVTYAIRIQWVGSYTTGSFGDSSSGSLTFLAAGSSNVTNRIFYNSITNGF
jgi:hypothetical protein